MSNLIGALGLRPPRGGFTSPPAETKKPAPAAANGNHIPETALVKWRGERQLVVVQLKSLAARTAKSRHVRAKDAIVEVQALVKNLANDPRTLQQVDELERWLREDAVVGDIDDLAVRIRAPLLGALAAARAAVQHGSAGSRN